MYWKRKQNAQYDRIDEVEETIAELKHHVNVTLDMDEMDLTAAERR